MPNVYKPRAFVLSALASSDHRLAVRMKNCVVVTFRGQKSNVFRVNGVELRALSGSEESEMENC